VKKNEGVLAFFFKKLLSFPARNRSSEVQIDVSGAPDLQDEQIPLLFLLQEIPGLRVKSS
jgi:hypothetical protein